jgi:DNA polymerase I-like protein with 3'-5' exonuclease and polymerase domains
MMDIVTVDFETYYDSDYSLSKLTTEEYIRSDKFETIGVSLKLNDGTPLWYSGDDVGGFLNSIDYSDKAVLAHHTAFDGAIMSWRYGIKPRLWLDTLSMARPRHAMNTGVSLRALGAHYDVGAKGDEVINARGLRRHQFSPEQLISYGKYCVNDNDMCYGLFRKLRRQLPVSELMLIDQTLRMFIEPQLELDTDMLRAHLADVRAKKAMLIRKVMEHTGDATEDDLKSRLMSNPQFAQLLIQLGAEPPEKISKTTGMRTYAFAKTDDGMKELANHPNIAVQTVVAARLGAKSTLEETRTEALLEIGQRGPLPVFLNYYGAHTGRHSGGGGINLQNLTRGSVIRKAMRAPKGKVVVPCDSSQIEARVLAYLAGQHDLLEAFRQGRDIYSEFASEIYGRVVRKPKPEEKGTPYGDQLEMDRFVGKTAILGLGYGMGAERFQITLAIGNGGVSIKISLDEARSIVQKYRARYAKIAALWTSAGHMLKTMARGGNGTFSTLQLKYDREEITLPNGMSLRYPLLNATSDGFRYINNPKVLQKALQLRITGDSLEDLGWVYMYGPKAVENITQALARIVVSEQMTAVGSVYPVVLQVHDELVPVADEAVQDEAKAFVKSVMSTPPVWAPTLPVACEVKAGATYGGAR